MLTIGLENSEVIIECRKAMDAIQSPYEELTARDIHRRYRTIRVNDNHVGLLDPLAGSLKADKCLQALQVRRRDFKKKKKKRYGITQMVECTRHFLHKFHKVLFSTLIYRTVS